MITPLKKDQVTHLSCLITGDRFYLTSDTVKEVWELRHHTKIFIKGRQKQLSVCKKDNGEVRKFISTRMCVYLRSNNPRRQPGYKKYIDNSLDRFFIH